MARSSREMRASRVFVNCPFDDNFKPVFDAILFAIHDLGFEARHALLNNGDDVRLTRIAQEIAGSAYSVHDLSRVELSGKMKVPRFNMPFEAGIAYAHSLRAGKDKHCILLLDSKAYRYQAALSDAAGLDPKIHSDKPNDAIEHVRGFLAAKSGKNLPGGEHIAKRFGLFLAKLPDAANAANISPNELRKLSYISDLQKLMASWIASNPP